MEPNIFTLLLVFIIYIFHTSTKPSVIKSKGPHKPFFTKLIYTDTKSKKYDSSMLKSQKYGLRGKPDLIYKSLFTKKYYPIELKSGVLGKDVKTPRDGDLMQLCAYFFIIEEHYNCKVPYGKLIYKDTLFIVKNNRYMRRTFLKVINEMRNFSENDNDFTLNKKVCNSCYLKHILCTHCNQ